MVELAGISGLRRRQQRNDTNRANPEPGDTRVKVLHVIPSLSLAHGGPTRAMLMMEQALLQQGVEVDIATTDDDGPGRYLRMPGHQEAAPIVQRGTRHYFHKWLEFYKVSPALLPWLWRHVTDYDIVHVHALFSFSSVGAGLIARCKGIPFVIRPLGTLNQYGIRQRRPLLKRLSLRWIEGPLLRSAAAVHFTAEAEQQEVASLGLALHGVVLPLGVAPITVAGADNLATEFPQLTGRRFLLFLSRLDPKKNVEGLLQAFAQLSPEFPALMLVIAGNGDAAYEERLKELAIRLQLTDRVIWAGFVDGDRKAALLTAADLFVLPSYSENFGIAVAEALLAGLPCVVGEGVALAASVREAGAGLSTTPDADSIATAIRRIASDQRLRDDMRLRAVELARERYSLTAMGVNLRQLYERILSVRHS